MQALQRIVAITSMNLQTVPQRLAAVSVIVIGIAGAVGVLISVLSLSQGLLATLQSTGRPDRAVVHSSGGIDQNAFLQVMHASGVKHEAGGASLVSGEVLAYGFANKLADGQEARVSVRGVGSVAPDLRPEFHLVDGRLFRPGLNELVVGVGARGKFQALGVGQRIRLPGGDWTIVGVFAAGGTALESELLGDVTTLMSGFSQTDYSQILVRLDAASSFTRFKDELTRNGSLLVEIEREPDFYYRRSKGFYAMLRTVAYFIGAIMTIGALLGALNTIHAIVSSRAVEIATLRAIGFGPAPVVISILVEALLLGGIGALLGAGAAWLLFDGDSLSLLAGSNNTQLVFALAITPQVMVLGIVWGCVTGLLGGLIPAVRAARQPVATALRAL